MYTWFTRPWEHIKVLDELDPKTLSQGQMELKKHKVLIVGIVRDSVLDVHSVSQYIEHTGPFLRDYRVIIFENDSTDGTKWVLNLSPSFENAIHKMDLTKLDSNLVGIYRYKKLDTDEIVYIGKGQIKHRFNSPERKDWDFDIIEYSEIKENDSQNKWESYWIEKFKKDFKKLPRYNSIGGKRLKKTK